MRNILKGVFSPKAEPYIFPKAEELQFEEFQPEEEAAFEPLIPEMDPPPGEEEHSFDVQIPPESEELDAPPGPEPPQSQGPVQYAQLQAELILKQAREDADQLLEQARQQAAEEAEMVRAGARDEGYREGYAQGLANAVEEGKKDREVQAARLEEDVKRFLEKATLARDELLSQSQDELLDLCIAVAEKVVRVSLKSSSEVIARMIQTATEKLKRQEWVHIYIAGCDAKGIAQISASLTASLGALSEHIRIVPMGDDEAGTCIVETPAGIIDASVSTQLSNIKDILKERL